MLRIDNSEFDEEKLAFLAKRFPNFYRKKNKSFKSPRREGLSERFSKSIEKNEDVNIRRMRR